MLFEVLPKRCLPRLCCVRVVHESFVAADGFSGSGTYHRHCNLLEIKSGCHAQILSQFCRHVQIGGLLPEPLD